MTKEQLYEKYLILRIAFYNTYSTPIGEQTKALLQVCLEQQNQINELLERVKDLEEARFTEVLM